MNRIHQAGTVINSPTTTSTYIPSPPRRKISRPALRLISTNNLSYDSWLNVRKQGIGSSDAAAAVGLNPYQSMLELWMIKTGRDSQMPKPDQNDESSPMTGARY